MRELSKVQSILFAIGASLMVIGVGLVVFMPLDSAKCGAIAFALGAILFAGIQMSQIYIGNNLIIRRLRRIMVIADIAFIVAALLLLENFFRIVYPLFATTINSYNAYVHYVHNNWVVILLVAAILEMYSMHRISYELKKEERA